MAGYLPDEANADAFADGWYRTGDVGWLEPEGWVHLTDRSKEMIKVNGFQVAPAEIEAVLHGHPAVARLRGVRRAPTSGPARCRSPRCSSIRPCPVADGELEQLVADSLATYKHLRHVVVVDAIPRLPSGKVLRRTLRDEWTPSLLAVGSDALMDVRLSAEQQALRDSAAQVVDRLGPQTVARARRRRAGRASSTPRSPPPAGASCAPRRRRRAAGVGGRGGHRRRGARPRPGRRAVPRPDAGRRAAAAGRRAGRRGAETVALAGPRPRLVADGGRRRRDRRRGRSVGARARRRRHGWPTVALPADAGGVDLTRPSVAVDDAAPTRSPVGDAARRRRPRALDRARPRAHERRPGRHDARRARSSPCEYATERRQYGVADRLVPGRAAPARRRALSLMEGSRQRGAARGVGRRRAAARRRARPPAAVAKAYCARAARTVCETAIQVHGGIGNTWECLAHVYLRRALLSTRRVRRRRRQPRARARSTHGDSEAADGLP